jgi:hypothetical protein
LYTEPVSDAKYPFSGVNKAAFIDPRPFEPEDGQSIHGVPLVKLLKVKTRGDPSPTSAFAAAPFTPVARTRSLQASDTRRATSLIAIRSSTYRNA